MEICLIQFFFLVLITQIMKQVKKKKNGFIFIARKATSTDTKVYDNKVTKIVKGEKGVAAEKTATSDGTTTVLNKEESGFKSY